MAQTAVKGTGSSVTHGLHLGVKLDISDFTVMITRDKTVVLTSLLSMDRAAQVIHPL
jgi:hypothetical protein